MMLGNVIMLPCIRKVMREYGMHIEIKRSRKHLGSLMEVGLAKYDENGQIIETDLDIYVTDTKMEKGLFELEYETAKQTGFKSVNGLEPLIDMLRKNKFNLPPHYDLREDIVMKDYVILIGFSRTDASGKDLYVGILMLNGKEIVRTAQQPRIGHVIDNLECTLLSKKCDDYRTSVSEFLQKYNNPK